MSANGKQLERGRAGRSHRSVKRKRRALQKRTLSPPHPGRAAPRDNGNMVSLPEYLSRKVQAKFRTDGLARATKTEKAWANSGLPGRHEAAPSRLHGAHGLPTPALTTPNSACAPRSFPCPPGKAGPSSAEFGGSDAESPSSAHTEATVPQTLRLLNGLETSLLTNKKNCVRPRSLRAIDSPSKRLDFLFLSLYSALPTED